MATRPLLRWLACAALVAAAACGGAEYGAIGTARAPGADARFTAEDVEGGALMLTGHITNLVAPDTVYPEGRVFVVWVIPPSGVPDGKATVRYNGDFREGSFAVTTRARAFELRVTAEPSGDAGAPSEMVVVSRRVSE